MTIDSYTAEILRSAADAVVTLSRSGIIRTALINRKHRPYISETDFAGLPLVELFPEAHRREPASVLNGSLSTIAASSIRTFIQFGKLVFPARIVITPFLKLRSDDLFAYAVITDISKEAAAEQKEARVFDELSVTSFLLENTPHPIILLDSENTIQFWNEAAAHFFSRSRPSVIGNNCSSVLPFLLSEQIETIRETITQNGGEYRVTLPEGNGLKNSSTFLFRMNNTLPFRLFITCTPAEAESISKKQFDVYRSIFDSSINGIALLKDKNIFLANPAFISLFGFSSEEEICAAPIESLFPSFDTIKASLDRAFGTSRLPAFECEALRKDGRMLTVDASLQYADAEQNDVLILSVIDIGEQKKILDTVKISEERYRSVAEHIDDFFYIVEEIDKKLKVAFFSQGVERITGYSDTEMLADSRLFFRIIHPDDFSAVKDKLKRLMRNYYRKSGSVEFRIIHRNGSVVWLKNKLSILRDENFRIQRIFGLMSDISMQKKAEDEVKRGNELLKEMNATKDRFVSIISHDLRTPFSSILGFTDLLLGDHELTPQEQVQYISYIRDSSRNMLTLVNTLLDLTRFQTGRIPFTPKKFDFRDIAFRVIQNTGGAALQKNIRLYSDIDEGLPVFGDMNFLSQAFNNLISNAIKFTPKNGEILIGQNETQNRRFVEVFVRDTGKGIAPENLSKLFDIDAKFTTDGTEGEKGTGFGLALVKEIIARHRGKITVESTLGEGTTFTVTLPKASATILLVDPKKTDQVLYAKIIKGITTDYDIEVCETGKEVPEKIKKTPPVLCIIEHDLPDGAGHELVRAIRDNEEQRSLPIIIISAKQLKDEKIIYSDLGVNDIFKKPVPMQTFRDTVERALSTFAL